MSEHDEPSARVVASEINEAHGAGALLRAAREAAGLDIAVLALSLKVPVKKLEALEADSWELLHDSAFIRALAATVCRTLKLDPVPVLDRLPALSHNLASDPGSINAPFHGASFGGIGLTAFRHLSRPLFLSVIALLVGAIVLILLPEFPIMAVKSTGLPVQAVANSSLAAPPAEIGGRVMSFGESMNSGLPSISSTVTVSPLSETGGPSLPANTAALTSVSSGPSISNSPSQSDGSLVMFKTSGSSWVQVTDARGVILLRKLMQAGESTGISGALPLAVLVGRSDVTSVEVRGKQLDLNEIARDNVARFEVK